VVPKGIFSILLQSFLKGGQKTYLDCSIACNIYGPLYPLPAGFGYVPFYGCGDCNSNSCLCFCPHLLLVGAGTGVLPFLNVIAAALNNKRDETKIKLIFLSGYKGIDGDKGFEESVRIKIDNMKMTDICIGFGRSVTQRKALNFKDSMYLHFHLKLQVFRGIPQRRYGILDGFRWV
jgi:hypothetical protein